jgi:hypothetical protein
MQLNHLVFLFNNGNRFVFAPVENAPNALKFASTGAVLYCNNTIRAKSGANSQIFKSDHLENPLISFDGFIIIEIRELVKKNPNKKAPRKGLIFRCGLSQKC